MTIAFDPRTHEYRVNGRVRSSVTQLLKLAGYIDASFYTPEAAERGTRVHATTALIDEQIGGIAVPNGLDGEVRAYLKFLSDMKPRFMMIEQAVTDDAGIVCGRPDRVFWKMGSIAGLGVLEIKTGACAPWHAYQTAGYAYLVSSQYIENGKDAPREVASRWCVHLRKNGTYRLRQHTSPRDRAVFLYALAHFGQENHG
jgi:hypothetical protein